GPPRPSPPSAEACCSTHPTPTPRRWRNACWPRPGRRSARRARRHLDGHGPIRLRDADREAIDPPTAFCCGHGLGPFRMKVTSFRGRGKHPPRPVGTRRREVAPVNDPTHASGGEGRFATTRWGLVAMARDGGSPEADAALAELFRAYWYPIYAYIRRR